MLNNTASICVINPTKETYYIIKKITRLINKQYTNTRLIKIYYINLKSRIDINLYFFIQISEYVIYEYNSFNEPSFNIIDLTQLLNISKNKKLIILFNSNDNQNYKMNDIKLKTIKKLFSKTFCTIPLIIHSNVRNSSLKSLLIKFFFQITTRFSMHNKTTNENIIHSSLLICFLKVIFKKKVVKEYIISQKKIKLINLNNSTHLFNKVEYIIFPNICSMKIKNLSNKNKSPNTRKAIILHIDINCKNPSSNTLLLKYIKSSILLYLEYFLNKLIFSAFINGIVFGLIQERIYLYKSIFIVKIIKSSFYKKSLKSFRLLKIYGYMIKLHL